MVQIVCFVSNICRIPNSVIYNKSIWWRSILSVTLLNTLTMFIIGFCICDKGITQFFCSINKKNLAISSSLFYYFIFWFADSLFLMIVHAPREKRFFLMESLRRYQKLCFSAITDFSWTKFFLQPKKRTKHINFRDPKFWGLNYYIIRKYQTKSIVELELHIWTENNVISSVKSR